MPDLRPEGIPADVCAAIEKAMSKEPDDRQQSAEEFGRELQLAQRHNGLTADPMALSEPGGEPGGEPEAARESHPSEFHAPSSGVSPSDSPRGRCSGPGYVRAHHVGQCVERAVATLHTSARRHTSASRATPPPGAPLRRTFPRRPFPPAAETPKKDRKRILIAVGAAVAALLLVVGGIYIVTSSRDKTGGEAAAPSQPTVEPQAVWEPIADARVARDAVAATQADGTIWIFGGMGADNRVSTGHEGYDPAIDSWKGGEDLPVAVQHAMSVTWQDTPVVLGGWRTEGTNPKVATDQVWRVVNSRWTELPPLMQPRAAAAAAVVDDRIIVTGGVDADGALLNTTEIFDGSSWKPGAPIPTPRQMLAARQTASSCTPSAAQTEPLT